MSGAYLLQYYFSTVEHGTVPLKFITRKTLTNMYYSRRVITNHSFTMRWEAANLSSPSSQRTEVASSSRKSSETVGAALARLTKAYSIAMSCLGAMHKLDAASETEGRGITSSTESKACTSSAGSL
jgi:hypothetical protein